VETQQSPEIFSKETQKRSTFYWYDRKGQIEHFKTFAARQMSQIDFYKNSVLSETPIEESIEIIRQQEQDQKGQWKARVRTFSRNSTAGIEYTSVFSKYGDLVRTESLYEFQALEEKEGKKTAKEQTIMKATDLFYDENARLNMTITYDAEAEKIGEKRHVARIKDFSKANFIYEVSREYKSELVDPSEKLRINKNSPRWRDGVLFREVLQINTTKKLIQEHKKLDELRVNFLFDDKDLKERFVNSVLGYDGFGQTVYTQTYNDNFVEKTEKEDPVLISYGYFNEKGASIGTRTFHGDELLRQTFEVKYNPKEVSSEYDEMDMRTGANTRYFIEKGYLVKTVKTEGHRDHKYERHGYVYYDEHGRQKWNVVLSKALTEKEIGEGKTPWKKLEEAKVKKQKGQMGEVLFDSETQYADEQKYKKEDERFPKLKVGQVRVNTTNHFNTDVEYQFLDRGRKWMSIQNEAMFTYFQYDSAGYDLNAKTYHRSQLDLEKQKKRGEQFNPNTVKPLMRSKIVEWRREEGGTVVEVLNLVNGFYGVRREVKNRFGNAVALIKGHHHSEVQGGVVNDTVFKETEIEVNQFNGTVLGNMGMAVSSATFEYDHTKKINEYEKLVQVQNRGFLLGGFNDATDQAENKRREKVVLNAKSEEEIQKMFSEITVDNVYGKIVTILVHNVPSGQYEIQDKSFEGKQMDNTITRGVTVSKRTGQVVLDQEGKKVFQVVFAEVLGFADVNLDKKNQGNKDQNEALAILSTFDVPTFGRKYRVRPQDKFVGWTKENGQSRFVIKNVDGEKIVNMGVQEDFYTLPEDIILNTEDGHRLIGYTEFGLSDLEQKKGYTSAKEADILNRVSLEKFLDYKGHILAKVTYIDSKQEETSPLFNANGEKINSVTRNKSMSAAIEVTDYEKTYDGTSGRAKHSYSMSVSPENIKLMKHYLNDVSFNNWDGERGIEAQLKILRQTIADLVSRAGTPDANKENALGAIKELIVLFNTVNDPFISKVDAPPFISKTVWEQEIVNWLTPLKEKLEKWDSTQDPPVSGKDFQDIVKRMPIENGQTRKVYFYMQQIRLNALEEAHLVSVSKHNAVNYLVYNRQNGEWIQDIKDIRGRNLMLRRGRMSRENKEIVDQNTGMPVLNEETGLPDAKFIGVLRELSYVGRNLDTDYEKVLFGEFGVSAFRFLIKDKEDEEFLYEDLLFKEIPQTAELPEDSRMSAILKILNDSGIEPRKMTRWVKHYGKGGILYDIINLSNPQEPNIQGFQQEVKNAYGQIGMSFTGHIKPSTEEFVPDLAEIAEFYVPSGDPEEFQYLKAWETLKGLGAPSQVIKISNQEHFKKLLSEGALSENIASETQESFLYGKVGEKKYVTEVNDYVLGQSKDLVLEKRAILDENNDEKIRFVGFEYGGDFHPVFVEFSVWNETSKAWDWENYKYKEDRDKNNRDQAYAVLDIPTLDPDRPTLIDAKSFNIEKFKKQYPVHKQQSKNYKSELKTILDVKNQLTVRWMGISHDGVFQPLVVEFKKEKKEEGKKPETVLLKRFKYDFSFDKTSLETERCDDLEGLLGDYRTKGEAVSFHILHYKSIKDSTGNIIGRLTGYKEDGVFHPKFVEFENFKKDEKGYLQFSEGSSRYKYIEDEALDASFYNDFEAFKKYYEEHGNRIAKTEYIGMVKVGTMQVAEQPFTLRLPLYKVTDSVEHISLEIKDTKGRMFLRFTLNEKGEPELARVSKYSYTALGYMGMPDYTYTMDYNPKKPSFNPLDYDYNDVEKKEARDLSVSQGLNLFTQDAYSTVTNVRTGAITEEVINIITGKSPGQLTKPETEKTTRREKLSRGADNLLYERAQNNFDHNSIDVLTNWAKKKGFGEDEIEDLKNAMEQRLRDAETRGEVIPYKVDLAITVNDGDRINRLLLYKDIEDRHSWNRFVTYTPELDKDDQGLTRLGYGQSGWLFEEHQHSQTLKEGSYHLRLYTHNGLAQFSTVIHLDSEGKLKSETLYKVYKNTRTTRNNAVSSALKNSGDYRKDAEIDLLTEGEFVNQDALAHLDSVIKLELGTAEKTFLHQGRFAYRTKTILGERYTNEILTTFVPGDLMQNSTVGLPFSHFIRIMGSTISLELSEASADSDIVEGEAISTKEFSSSSVQITETAKPGASAKAETGLPEIRSDETQDPSKEFRKNNARTFTGLFLMFVFIAPILHILNRPLSKFKKRKVNLNEASDLDLKDLGILTPNQIGVLKQMNAHGIFLGTETEIMKAMDLDFRRNAQGDSDEKIKATIAELKKRISFTIPLSYREEQLERSNCLISWLNKRLKLKKDSKNNPYKIMINLIQQKQDSLPQDSTPEAQRPLLITKPLSSAEISAIIETDPNQFSSLNSEIFELGTIKVIQDILKSKFMTHEKMQQFIFDALKAAVVKNRRGVIRSTWNRKFIDKLYLEAYADVSTTGFKEGRRKKVLDVANDLRKQLFDNDNVTSSPWVEDKNENEDTKKTWDAMLDSFVENKIIREIEGHLVRRGELRAPVKGKESPSGLYVSYYFADIDVPSDLQKGYRLMSVEEFAMLNFIRRELSTLSGFGGIERYLMEKAMALLAEGNASKIIPMVQQYGDYFRGILQHVLSQVGERKPGDLAAYRGDDTAESTRPWPFLFNYDEFNDVFNYVMGKNDMGILDGTLKRKMSNFRNRIQKDLFEKIEEGEKFTEEELRIHVKKHFQPFILSIREDLGINTAKNRLDMGMFTTGALSKVLTNLALLKTVFSKGLSGERRSELLKTKHWKSVLAFTIVCFVFILLPSVFALHLFSLIAVFNVIPISIPSLIGIGLILISSLVSHIFGKDGKFLLFIGFAILILMTISTFFGTLPGFLIWELSLDWFLPKLVFYSLGLLLVLEMFTITIPAAKDVLKGILTWAYSREMDLYHVTSYESGKDALIEALFNDTEGTYEKTVGLERLNLFEIWIEEEMGDLDLGKDSKYEEKPFLAGVISMAERKEFREFIKTVKPMLNDKQKFSDLTEQNKKDLFNQLPETLRTDAAKERFKAFVNKFYRKDIQPIPRDPLDILSISMTPVGIAEHYRRSFQALNEVILTAKANEMIKNASTRLGMIARANAEEWKILLEELERARHIDHERRKNFLLLLDNPKMQLNIEEEEIKSIIEKWANQKLGSVQLNIHDLMKAGRPIAYWVERYNERHPQPLSKAEIEKNISKAKYNKIIANMAYEDSFVGKGKKSPGIIDLIQWENKEPRRAGLNEKKPHHNNFYLYMKYLREFKTIKGKDLEEADIIKDFNFFSQDRNALIEHYKLNKLKDDPFSGKLLMDVVLLCVNQGMEYFPRIDYRGSKSETLGAALPFTVGEVHFTIDCDHRHNLEEMWQLPQSCHRFVDNPRLGMLTPSIRHNISRNYTTVGKAMSDAEDAFYNWTLLGKDITDSVLAYGKMAQRKEVELSMGSMIGGSRVAEDAVGMLQYMLYGFESETMLMVSIEKQWPYENYLAMTPQRKWSGNSPELVLEQPMQRLLASPFVPASWKVGNIAGDGTMFYTKKPYIVRYLKLLFLTCLILPLNPLVGVPLFIGINSILLSQAISFGLLFNNFVFRDTSKIDAWMKSWKRFIFPSLCLLASLGIVWFFSLFPLAIAVSALGVFLFQKSFQTNFLKWIKAISITSMHIVTRMFLFHVSRIGEYAESVGMKGVNRITAFIQTTGKASASATEMIWMSVYLRHSWTMKMGVALSIILLLFAGFHPLPLLIYLPLIGTVFVFFMSPYLMVSAYLQKDPFSTKLFNWIIKLLARMCFMNMTLTDLKAIVTTLAIFITVVGLSFGLGFFAPTIPLITNPGSVLVPFVIAFIGFFAAYKFYSKSWLKKINILFLVATPILSFFINPGLFAPLLIIAVTFGSVYSWYPNTPWLKIIGFGISDTLAHMKYWLLGDTERKRIIGEIKENIEKAKKLKKRALELGMQDIVTALEGLDIEKVLEKYKSGALFEYVGPPSLVYAHTLKHYEEEINITEKTKYREGRYLISNMKEADLYAEYWLILPELVVSDKEQVAFRNFFEKVQNKYEAFQEEADKHIEDVNEKKKANEKSIENDEERKKANALMETENRKWFVTQLHTSLDVFGKRNLIQLISEIKDFVTLDKNVRDLLEYYNDEHIKELLKQFIANIGKNTEEYKNAKHSLQNWVNQKIISTKIGEEEEESAKIPVLNEVLRFSKEPNSDGPPNLFMPIPDVDLLVKARSKMELAEIFTPFDEPINAKQEKYLWPYVQAITDIRSVFSSKDTPLEIKLEECFKALGLIRISENKGKETETDEASALIKAEKQFEWVLKHINSLLILDREIQEEANDEMRTYLKALIKELYSKVRAFNPEGSVPQKQAGEEIRLGVIQLKIWLALNKAIKEKTNLDNPQFMANLKAWITEIQNFERLISLLTKSKPEILDQGHEITSDEISTFVEVGRWMHPQEFNMNPEAMNAEQKKYLCKYIREIIDTRSIFSAMQKQGFAYFTGEIGENNRKVLEKALEDDFTQLSINTADIKKHVEQTLEAHINTIRAEIFKARVISALGKKETHLEGVALKSLSNLKESILEKKENKEILNALASISIPNRLTPKEKFMENSSYALLLEAGQWMSLDEILPVPVEKMNDKQKRYHWEYVQGIAHIRSVFSQMQQDGVKRNPEYFNETNQTVLEQKLLDHFERLSLANDKDLKEDSVKEFEWVITQINWLPLKPDPMHYDFLAWLESFWGLHLLAKIPGVRTVLNWKPLSRILRSILGFFGTMVGTEALIHLKHWVVPILGPFVGGLGVGMYLVQKCSILQGFPYSFTFMTLFSLSPLSVFLILLISGYLIGSQFFKWRKAILFTFVFACFFTPLVFYIDAALITVGIVIVFYLITWGILVPLYWKHLDKKISKDELEEQRKAILEKSSLPPKEFFLSLVNSKWDLSDTDKTVLLFEIFKRTTGKEILNHSGFLAPEFLTFIDKDSDLSRILIELQNPKKFSDLKKFSDSYRENLKFMRNLERRILETPMDPANSLAFIKMMESVIETENVGEIENVIPAEAGIQIQRSLAQSDGDLFEKLLDKLFPGAEQVSTPSIQPNPPETPSDRNALERDFRKQLNDLWKEDEQKQQAFTEVAAILSSMDPEILSSMDPKDFHGLIGYEGSRDLNAESIDAMISVASQIDGSLNEYLTKFLSRYSNEGQKNIKLSLLLRMALHQPKAFENCLKGSSIDKTVVNRLLAEVAKLRDVLKISVEKMKTPNFEKVQNNFFLLIQEAIKDGALFVDKLEQLSFQEKLNSMTNKEHLASEEDVDSYTFVLARLISMLYEKRFDTPVPILDTIGHSREQKEAA
jgi:hypothetical protein